MKKLFASALLFALTSTSASAKITNNEFAKCAAIKGDLERLECFDKLAKEKKLDAPQVQVTSTVGKGAWYVDTKTNPVDDSKTVTLMLDAKSGKSRWDERVFLVARCQSNTTDLYIGWNDYLGDKANVLTRIGKHQAVTTRWAMSTDKKATFHKKPIPFLKEMVKADTLIAQVTPYNESPVTAIFDTAGLSEAIKPLRKTCSW